MYYMFCFLFVDRFCWLLWEQIYYFESFLALEVLALGDGGSMGNEKRLQKKNKKRKTIYMYIYIYIRVYMYIYIYIYSELS